MGVASVAMDVAVKHTDSTAINIASSIAVDSASAVLML
jgi:hypothetical protein